MNSNNNLKKILFISANKWQPWGGSEVLWSETAKIFLKNNIETGVCIKKWPVLPKQFESFATYPHHRYFFKEIKFNLMQRIYNRFVPAKLKIQAAEKFKADILAWQPELTVISQGDNKAGIDMMEFCISNGLRYVTISQAAMESQWPADKTCERLAVGYSNAVCNYFVSEANRHLTEMQIGQLLSNAKVIRNPFNVPYENNIPYPSSDNGFKLASVGRYDFVAKGQDILLQVLNDQKWKDRNVTVNFYGSGMNQKSLQKLIALFDLKNTNVKGYISSTTEIWEENHILIMPSRYEGLPLSIVEAMLCGRTSVVTDVSGNKEALIDNVNGFVANAPSVKWLDEAMELAWQRRHEWEAMGAKAKEHIKTLVPEDPALEFYKELSTLLLINQ